MKPGSDDDQMSSQHEIDETEALEKKAQLLRQHVDILLMEADRRRHAATDAVSVKRQIGLHPGVALGIVAGFTALTVLVPILLVQRARKRNSLPARAHALREAFGRILKRPDRVAETRAHLPQKLLTAVLVATATTVAKKEIEKLLTRKPSPPAPIY
jgi:hypothetical protein